MPIGPFKIIWLEDNFKAPFQETYMLSSNATRCTCLVLNEILYSLYNFAYF